MRKIATVIGALVLGASLLSGCSDDVMYNGTPPESNNVYEGIIVDDEGSKVRDGCNGDAVKYVISYEIRKKESKVDDYCSKKARFQIGDKIKVVTQFGGIKAVYK